MKRSGKVELVTGMYFLFILLTVIMVQFQMKLFAYAGAYVEDALAASNLASAVMDVEEYGKTGEVLIASPAASYSRYWTALRHNMSLAADGSHNGGVIAGCVNVECYRVYNVKEQDVTIYSFGECGSSVQRIEGGLGSVRTPDGTVVENTSVYSRISFPVKGILGLEIIAGKEKTVDIAKNGEVEG